MGPESAGSTPGPACYGRGGTLPTVSDAAAVLGYLDPNYFLGGRMKLDREAARRAIAPLAERLAITPEETAYLTEGDENRSLRKPSFAEWQHLFRHRTTAANV